MTRDGLGGARRGSDDDDDHAPAVVEFRALVDGTPCRPGDRVRIVALHVRSGDAEWCPAETLALYNAAALRPQRVREVDGNGEAVWVVIDVEDDGTPGTEGAPNALCVLPGELARVE